MGSGGELLIERLAGLLQDHLDLLSSIKTHISYIRAGGGDRGELEGYISSLREIRASIHQGFEEALDLAFKGDIDVEDLAALLVYYVESGVKDEGGLLEEVSEYIDVSGDIKDLESWVERVRPKIESLVGGVHGGR